MRKAHDCEVFYFFIFFNLNFYKLAKFQYKSFKCLKRPIYINSIKYFIWERLTMVNCFNSINIFIQERIMIVKLLFIYLNELELPLLFLLLESLSRCHSFFSPKMYPLVHFHNKSFKYLKKIILIFFFFIQERLSCEQQYHLIFKNLFLNCIFLKRRRKEVVVKDTIIVRDN